jgi:hypothetical protein
VEFRIMEPNGMDVDDSVIGTATGEGEGGGWSLTIDGPMTPSPNTTPPTHDHSAQLRDGDGNIKDTSANIGVWQ